MIHFIQDHMFQLGEIQFIVLKVVFDAARGADQDVDSIADRFNCTQRVKRMSEHFLMCQTKTVRRVRCCLKLQCRVEQSEE